MSIAEGQSLGNYRILDKIGTGGMGMVYLAEHPLIGKKVALKVIHKELASNREVISRFFNEARAVNRIGSEHIVEIHDFGQSPDGEHFFIMEYLEGRTLADELAARGTLDPQRVLHVSAQIAAGLAAAHACGIIHRDLKPDNIMLIERRGDHDYVKILDFGLAKMFIDAGGAKLTAQGVVLGTPQYMSPEACESKQDIDHRSDIYALGVLMFQMLTAQVPFNGESMGEILVQHVTQAPPAPRGINPAIPPSVEQIVLRCLAKHPDDRFASMNELRDALLDPERYLASSPPIMPSSPKSNPQAKTMFATAPDASAGGPPPAANGTGRHYALQPPPPSQVAPSTAGAKTAFMEAPGQGAPPPPAGPAGYPPAPQPAGPPGPAAELRPVPAVNSTMVIGTPTGYSDRPRSKRWATLVAVAGITAMIGGGAALVVASGGEKEAATATPEPAPAEPAGPPAAAQVPPDAAAPQVVEPAEITVKLATDPAGAEVFDAAGERLGVTPVDIRLPRDGQEHRLTFRHEQAEEETKAVVASGDSSLSIELTPRATPRRDTRRPPRERRPPPRRRPDPTRVDDSTILAPDI